MNAYQIAQPQTGAAVSVDLQKLHPGNRLRLMLGLPLLPEPESMNTIAVKFCDPSFDGKSAKIQTVLFECPAPTAKK